MSRGNPTDVFPPEGFILAEGTDPAEDLIGPFYMKRYMKREGEHCATGLITGERHTNKMGTVHGGVLMTFADYTLCAVGKTGSDDESIVTVSLTTDFVRAAPAGGWLSGEASISRRTRSLVFVQGRLCHDGSVVMTFSGIGKRIPGEG